MYKIIWKYKVREQTDMCQLCKTGKCSHSNIFFIEILLLTKPSAPPALTDGRDLFF